MAEEQHTAGYYLVMGTMTPEDTITAVDLVGGWESLEIKVQCSYCQTRWASVTVVRFHPAHQFVRGEFYDQDGVPVRAFDVVQRHHQMIVRTDADPVGTWRVTRAHGLSPRTARFGVRYVSQTVSVANLRGYFSRDLQ
ncbi:hypothetical protein RND81_05G272500 [Saponaria officinalis]|uniref:Uncharacterized protein n=1 Tax=Saponaria officinalis TaxID=3572 RepID=A0AAW1L1V9_SAPOF